MPRFVKALDLVLFISDAILDCVSVNNEPPPMPLEAIDEATAFCWFSIFSVVPLFIKSLYPPKIELMLSLNWLIS